MASVYTVTQVTAYIRNMFTQDFALNRISIKGEVSNCKYHTSGHIYFTLKDGGSQIAAVMFAGQRKGLTFELEEGQEVTVTGNVDVYERDGRYQLYAKEITREGRGDLFARFEKLRNELEDMGMFDGCYKQPIPKYALKVGIVTASTGAAIRDIMNISARRNPYVQLILYPALVQGERAKFSIVKGIETLDRMGLDVIIVGRGGGSIEDLSAFNEEMVARAIFNSTTPIISCLLYTSLDYTTVKAPISGVVETRNVEPHDHVDTSAEICVISAGEQLQVKFGITEKILKHMKAGDTVSVEKNGTSYEGQVTEVGTMANPSTGLYDVKAEISQTGGLTSGTKVKLTVVMDQARSVMTVPVDAVNYDNGEAFVYCYQDGSARKTKIVSGIYDSGRMEVISGLDSSSLVITSWSNELLDGAQVILDTREAGE